MGLPVKTAGWEERQIYGAGSGIRNKRGKGGNAIMVGKNFMTVEEVAQELNVSKSYAYKVVRELNAEMRELGYLTVTGRVNTNFFRKKLCYSE